MSSPPVPPQSSLRSGDMTLDDGESAITLSASLRRSLFQVVDGRRSQASTDSYPWTCDVESDAFKIAQHACSIAIHNGNLFWEPRPGLVAETLAAVQGRRPRTLDVGCGSLSLWTIEFAEQNPGVEVIGVDLVPSDALYVPPNLDFEIQNVAEGLHYPDDYFDFVHCRTLHRWVPIETILPEYRRVLAPGGILIIEEGDSMFHSNVPSLHIEAMERCELRAFHEIPLRPLNGLSEDLIAPCQEWGHVVCASWKAPIGSTPDVERSKDVGYHTRKAWLAVWAQDAFAEGLDHAETLKMARRDETLLPEAGNGLFMLFRSVLIRRNRNT